MHSWQVWRMTNKDIVRGTSKVCSPANKENIQVQISWLLKYTPFQTWNEQNNLRSFDKAGINFILLIFIHRSAREKTNKKKSDRIKNLNQRFSITKIVQRSNERFKPQHLSIDSFPSSSFQRSFIPSIRRNSPTDKQFSLILLWERS